mgnify:CR=1 FL=1
MRLEVVHVRLEARVASVAAAAEAMAELGEPSDARARERVLRQVRARATSASAARQLAAVVGEARRRAARLEEPRGERVEHRHA